MLGPSRRIARRTARRTARRRVATQGGPTPEPDPPADPAPADAPDPEAQLEQLAALTRQGILTRQEFEEKKRKVLGS